jgi:hypothetical protein
MRGGGTQCHLMRCSDNAFYVIKFQNNPQGKRTLANDFFGTLLAERLGLPVARSAVIEVSENLIKLTDEMTVNLQRTRVPCTPGRSFGSRYASIDLRGNSIGPELVFDFMPPERLRKVTNLTDFIGMMVFDKWTCNQDSRQAVFVQNRADASWTATMIDHGKCFGGVDWDFRDHPGFGLYYPSMVYESVRGIDEFDPWIDRLQTKIDAGVLEQLAEEIPREWYGQNSSALCRMLDTLDRRRAMIHDLLWQTWRSSRRTFPNWIERRSCERRKRAVSA